ncbi:MAG: hypothetical protein FRX49_08979 [Trebouxia sp. A1-2]|nr:MAG: hypothetical protein FRX49_08979 [Trebouxia sp. A1-2]
MHAECSRWDYRYREGRRAGQAGAGQGRQGRAGRGSRAGQAAAGQGRAGTAGLIKEPSPIMPTDVLCSARAGRKANKGLVAISPKGPVFVFLRPMAG